MRMSCQSSSPNIKANAQQLPIPADVDAVPPQTSCERRNTFSSTSDGAAQLNSLFLAGAGDGFGHMMNQSLLCHQLQQLQTQQQQLQIQSAELMRQTIANQNFGGALNPEHQEQFDANFDINYGSDAAK